MRRVLAMMSVLALGAAVPLQNEAAADGGTVIHVSVSSGSDSGDGSATSPYKTISTALTKASDGDTIELAEGVYQEGELMVTKSVTITAASGAKPVISGAKSPDTWKDAGNGTWATANDMVRFCDVCTTNADPSVEGMAAHPEQVFVDGQPLTQVATRAEVTASTFFVDDPDPVTLKDPKNNRAGYNVKPHTGTSYVIGVNPAEHKVEVVQHSRALTVTTDRVSLKNLTVEKYAPVQAWDYKDPQIGTLSGGAMVLAGGQGLKIENSAFRYASAATALAITDAKEATISGNTIENNGAVGFGINRSSNVNVEKNRWTSNNTAGFNTTSCGAYCTIGDTKITHSEGIRYAYNTVDYSNAGTDVSKPDTYKNDQRAGVWFDEGVINSQVIGNYFVNVPVAIFNEVSSKNMIASNIIEGAGIGIHVSGSDNTQIWNNTISHALTSIAIREDSRSKGCNARKEDGSCAAEEKWSIEHGLSWDTTGTEVFNNILSSEQSSALADDKWRYSATLQVVGGKNDDGSGAFYANEMVAGIDHNAYYRAPAQPEVPNTTVMWNWGPDRLKESVNAETLSEFTNNEHVKVSDREANGLDLRGTREENPLFVREAADPTAWKTSDFHPKPGGPAVASGRPLPENVAKALGKQAGVAVDRGALFNAAWQDGEPSAPPSSPTPTSSGTPTPSPSDPRGGKMKPGLPRTGIPAWTA